MSAKTDPFSILVDIEAKSISLSEGLPAQEEVVELWRGIGFILAGHRFVAPMGEVVEILHVPRFTQIPGVKSWMHGLANVRGRLLPMLDLAGFFGFPGQTKTTRAKRVLVVENDDIFSGLIVDEVMGMQYFSVDSFEPKVKDIPDTIRPFIGGSYSRREERWMVFSTIALTQDASFLEVAQV